jgi:hypothetical protein
MPWIRLLLSMMIATVLVLTGAAIGVRWFYDPEKQGESTAAFIERINLSSTSEIPGAEERRREKEREFVREGPSEREAPPAPAVPEREVSGFVQLEFVVFPDGSVENVEVVGAQPSGVYEERARQQIEARDYSGEVSPAETEGEHRTEVIEFSVPASEVEDGN